MRALLIILGIAAVAVGGFVSGALDAEGVDSAGAWLLAAAGFGAVAAGIDWRSDTRIVVRRSR